MKASPLMRAWLARLVAAGVTFKLRHHWIGWDDAGRLQFASPDGYAEVAADATVLALGGASWPRLGSDAGWVDPISRAGIGVTPLQPANCGFLVEWSEVFRNRFAGHPLKRIEVLFESHRARGEAVIAQGGIEGGVIYALSAPLREALASTGEAAIHIDLRPDVEHAGLERRLSAPRDKQSLATFLRKTVRLSPVETGLLHEAAIAAERRVADLPPAELASLIKAVPVRVRGVADVTRAISTAGGVSFDEIDHSYMLRKKPGVFVAGEMLDWEAPTGGYLLQASFATGVAAGKGVLAYLGTRHSGNEAENR
jgi:hypothetical protein